MLIWFWTKFFQSSKVFLRAYTSRTNFSKVFLRTYISLTKLHMYFGYNGLCTYDDVYKSFVRIFVRELATESLDVNGLVTDILDLSNNSKYY